MQIKISSRHGQLNEENHQKIHEKAEKLLHLFGRIMMIEVLVDMREDASTVEFLVSAEHKHDFVASARHPDLLTATEAVLEKLESQVRKYKEKITDHRRRPAMGDVAPRKEEEEEES